MNPGTWWCLEENEYRAGYNNSGSIIGAFIVRSLNDDQDTIPYCN